MNDFSAIAPNYRQTATAQQSASERLLAMLALSRADDVLDLGCGTGHITQTLRALTDGRVVGLDPSEGMIAEARRNAEGALEFHTGPVESLHMPGSFDAIFCNSAFQWFRDPPRALANCLAALRPGGRMALQAPARTDYCPNFTRAADALRHDPRTAETYSRFRSPWFFLETAQDYANLFTQAGFTVLSAEIETVTQRCTPAKAQEVFDSGAAAGYLNPAWYGAPFPPDYPAAAREVITRDLHAQAGADGLLDLIFHRIYLLARRP